MSRATAAKTRPAPAPITRNARDENIRERTPPADISATSAFKPDRRSTSTGGLMVYPAAPRRASGAALAPPREQVGRKIRRRAPLAMRTGRQRLRIEFGH